MHTGIPFMYTAMNLHILKGTKALEYVGRDGLKLVVAQVSVHNIVGLEKCARKLQEIPKTETYNSVSVRF